MTLIALFAIPATATAQSARTRYESARAREQTLRHRLETAAASLAPERASVIREAERIISAYEALVRRYPASAYSDNALWQAAELHRVLADRFARDENRNTALAAYRQLISEYSSSSLLQKARAAMTSLERSRDAVRVPSASPNTVAAADSTAFPGRPMLTNIERVVLPEAVRITLFVDQEIAYREERIVGPSRVFFDLQGVGVPPALKDASLTFDEDLVRHIRVGRHPNSTVRVVLDIEGVSRYSVFTLYNPFRLVIDCERAPAHGRATDTRRAESVTIGTPIPARRAAPIAQGPPTVSRVPAKVAAEPDALPAARWDSEPAAESPLKSPASAASPDVVQATRRPARAREETPTRPAVTAVPSRETTTAGNVPPASPVANSVGGFSIARQLGLGASRIVIDPGHGGRDPGAGVRDLNEAELTLDVALRLERLLQDEPGLDVILTRRTDVYVPLEERTAIANRENADFFLSIHANASRNASARGVETYYLSFASSADAEAVAARENAGSDRTMHNLPDIVKAIALNNKLDESRDLASMVQESLVSRLRRVNSGLRDLGVKKAPFVVLIGAGMPSVLAEMSFLTHRQDAQLLRTSAYRQRIAEALHAAVLRYRRSLKGSGKAAVQ